MKKIQGIEFFNELLDAIDLIKFLVDFGITDVDELGGKQYLIDEVLPEEYAGIFRKSNLSTIDAVLKGKNHRGILNLADNLTKWIDRQINSLEEGKKLVYHFFALSPEIILALDMTPLCWEVVGGVQSALYETECAVSIDRFESEGFPTYLCSAQKSGGGLFLENKIPKPYAFLKQIAICDPSNMAYDWAAHKYDVPLITMESPYYANERAFKFFIGEYKRMIEEMEKLSGNSLDEDKLRKHVELGNEAFRYMKKLQQLRKITPCPDTAWHRSIDEPFLTMFGMEEGIGWFKGHYEEAKGRKDKGEGVIPEGKEEIRCVWGWGFNAYALGFFDWLEEKYGATYLESGLSYFPPFLGMIDTKNVESMIEGLAWRNFHWPMTRQGMSFSDLWINDIVSVAKNYKADCLMLGAHVACKHFWPLNKLLSDRVKDELGIPSLRYEFDLMDNRFTPVSELKQIASEFFESL